MPELKQEHVDEVMAVLRAHITEENTDALINYTVGHVKLPKFIPDFAVKTILDHYLPEALLSAVEHVLKSKVQP